MLFKSVAAAGLLVTAASAHTLGQRQLVRSCKAPEPTAEQLKWAAKFQAEEAAARKAGRVGKKAIAVETYIHVVASSDSAAAAVSDATLNAQMDVLNQDYSETGVSFSLAGITRTGNSQWANDGDEIAMKTELRQGSYSTLNLYFTESLGGALGYCYFPTSAPEGSQAFTLDGCSNVISSLPGGEAPYDLGRTAVHEVGHWFGLYHTFQGGCSGDGDMVDDTPAEAEPAFGCDVGRDTCPAAGLDPVENFMDYSDDSCFTNFSPGQAARIASQWDQFRA